MDEKEAQELQEQRLREVLHSHALAEMPAKGTALLDYYHNFGAREQFKQEAPERTTEDIINEIKRIPLIEDKLKYLAEEIISRERDILWLQGCNQNVVSKLANESLIHRTLQQDIIKLQNSFWERLKFLVLP